MLALEQMLVCKVVKGHFSNGYQLLRSQKTVELLEKSLKRR
jgi:hypothetical protein